ncbi:MAG: Ig-like domain-containing protein [Treponema sp.]|nr:Ig-like domain-containing protein [Treponema sp.]
MLKKAVFISFLVALSCSTLWAGGNRDSNQSRSAEDVSGFTDSLDISELDPGTYNYYLEARDRAGNITLSGPENINIDPASDLPGINIINPVVNMHVQGNINIVGIAFDDDGVDHVELVITRGNDTRRPGEEVFRTRAEGTDYWSYFLDTSNSDIWTDGIYTITAWAVDINGLSGISERFNARQHRKSAVYWRLDRKKPETIVTSHEIGALVSGNIKLRGTVADGNGINAFGYSIDGGNRYSSVRTRYDRSSGLYNWEINLNTRRFDDGPVVIWLQGQDENGTRGVATHLLFVNNAGPQVTIVHPSPDTVVNGLFTIAGFARHPVGLSRVTWKAGNIANGEFELLPGNPWWSANVDLRGQRLSNIDIEIRAVDISGNVTTSKQRYRVNQADDLPVVTLIEPAAGVIDGREALTVRGNVSDDDGVSSIFYSLNGAAPVEMPCNGYFQFQIAQVPEGTNTLEVWAKDITGVTGSKVQVRGIIVPQALPVPSIFSFVSGTGRNQVINNFHTGMTLTVSPRTVMHLSVASSAPVASFNVSFGDLPPFAVRLSGSRDAFTGTMPLPAELHDGLTRIRLSVTDRLGREVTFNEYIYVANPVPVHGTLEMELPVLPPSFTWVRSKTINDGRILLTSTGDTLMGIASSPIRRVDIQGETEEAEHSLTARIDEHGRLILSADSAGDSGYVTLRMTDERNRTFESERFRVLSDFSDPSVRIINPVQDRRVIGSSSAGFLTEGTHYQAAVPVSFALASGGRIASVSMSKDMGVTWENLLTNEQIEAFTGSVNTQIERELDISSVDDGLLTILIRAVNESGRASTASFSVIKDSQGPQARLVVPSPESRVNGAVSMGFIVEENSDIASVRYYRPQYTRNAEDGTNVNEEEIDIEIFNFSSWSGDYRTRFIDTLMDPVNMPLDENMRFIFTDIAGNSFELSSWPFVIDMEMDVPVAQIILPEENETITSDFIISGIMFDDDKIRRIYWRIDDEEETEFEAEYGFSVPILLSTLTDNEHSVTVVAEDIYGVKSAPVTRNFRVSLAEPAAEVTFPNYDTVLNNTIEITGTAYDENGIHELQVSIDNGITYNRVHSGGFDTGETTIDWTYQFNTKILQDGPHVVFIRVWDGYGSIATYANMINIDNTPPSIALDSPRDGSVTVSGISVMGRVIDPNLESIFFEIRSLDGLEVIPELRSRQINAEDIIREVIDLGGQADGHYNIAVVATDKAGNITRNSRNFELARATHQNYIEILYPLDNENVNGEFYMYGYAGGSGRAGTVTIRINERDLETNEVDASGYFRFNLNNEMFTHGDNTVTVHSNFGGGEQVFSREHNLVYSHTGPWVTIDSFSFGSFAYNRPYVYGRTGYTLSPQDTVLLADRNTERRVRDEINQKSVDYTEISFDNGRSFVRTSSNPERGFDYRYRLETGFMTEGPHYIIVRATMKNGETAVTRMLVQVDKTPPVIQLISPESGGRYNEEIVYSATASDDVELVSLTYHLRAGDKAAYEIPGFLQGLYIEGVIPPFLRQIDNEIIPTLFAGGVTYTDFGIGLSFFDDNVKLQVQYGFMTQDIYESLGGVGLLRYGGHVLGLKLLASIYSLPFGSFLGPDWDWLSASFAIGANFSLFDVASEGYTQSGTPTWMSALLLQIEFPRVTLPDRTFLRTFSLFTEGQLWFVPTDVDAALNNIPTIIPHVIIGLRLYIF